MRACTQAPFLAAVVLALTITRPARAQDMAADVVLCKPENMPPGCLMAPAGRAPAVTPQEEAAFRAQATNEYIARQRPIEDAAAVRRVDEARRAAWLARGEETRPSNTPVAFPIVELNAGFRLGTVVRTTRSGRQSYGHAGPEVGGAFRFTRNVSVEVPIALMQTWSGDLGHWATIGLAPSFVVGNSTKRGNFWLRAGPDFLFPTGANGQAPTVLAGGMIGGGLVAYVAPLPNYGYVGIGIDLRLSLRAGAGGTTENFAATRFGADGVLTVRVGF